jgi:hypothetical protein
MPGRSSPGSGRSRSSSASSTFRPVNASTSAGSSRGTRNGWLESGLAAGRVSLAGSAASAASRRASSTCEGSSRPRAAATNNTRARPSRPSPSASNPAVSLRALWLTPRSRSLTVRGLTRADSASSS